LHEGVDTWLFSPYAQLKIQHHSLFVTLFDAGDQKRLARLCHYYLRPGTFFERSSKMKQWRFLRNDFTFECMPPQSDLPVTRIIQTNLLYMIDDE